MTLIEIVYDKNGIPTNLAQNGEDKPLLLYGVDDEGCGVPPVTGFYCTTEKSFLNNIDHYSVPFQPVSFVSIPETPYGSHEVPTVNGEVV